MKFNILSDPSSIYAAEVAVAPFFGNTICTTRILNVRLQKMDLYLIILLPGKLYPVGNPCL